LQLINDLIKSISSIDNNTVINTEKHDSSHTSTPHSRHHTTKLNSNPLHQIPPHTSTGRTTRTSLAANNKLQNNVNNVSIWFKTQFLSGDKTYGYLIYNLLAMWFPKPV
jgi:hypothetical protein